MSDTWEEGRVVRVTFVPKGRRGQLEGAGSAGEGGGLRRREGGGLTRREGGGLTRWRAAVWKGEGMITETSFR